MTDETLDTRNARVREAFERLLEMPEAAHEPMLAAMDLDDEERAMVRRLLAGHARRRLFEVPALDWVHQLDGDDYVEAMIGTRVGTCELQRFLGRGGSAVVFLARRRVGDTVQAVALKLLNSGLLSPEAHRRFRREQAILSRLSHPNIARLIDAGMSERGSPYIVMEYVEGQDIVSFACARSFDTRARIALLVDVCRAVDAAHRALVVHRDLKPSNVLVTADGVVKVLDFGIAKLIDEDNPETATQHVALTPAYAAPEQFQPGPAATSMDVYSLGVLASELLLGGRMGPDATLPASEDATTWQNWRRLDGELTQILRATLASEPSRRYSSAGHLADDFRRWLDREPLQIVPVTRWYRLRKFVARHRTSAVAAALVALAFVGGTIGIAYQWRVARQQALLAREQAAVAHAEAVRAGTIRDFLASLFDAGNAESPQDRKPTIEDVVANAGQRLLSDDQLDASLRADLLLTLADVASSIGAYERSDRLLDEVERFAPALGAAAADVLVRLRVRRAGNLIDQTTTNAAPVLALLEPLRADLDARTDETGLKALTYRARALQVAGREAEADAEVDRIVARYRDADDAKLALTALLLQLNVAVEAQRYPEAVGFARTAIDYWSAHGQPLTVWTMTMWSNAATARESVGDIDGAEEAYRNAIAVGDRIYAQPARDHAMAIQAYGTFLLAQSRVDEAGTQILRALKLQQSMFRDDDPRIAQTFFAASRLYENRGDYAESIRWMDKAVQVYRGDGFSTMLARSLAMRGRTHANAGHFDEADRDEDEALAIQKAHSGDAHPAYAWILIVRADVELREHRFAQALATTEKALAINAPVGGALLQSTLDTRLNHAKALLALGRGTEALAELQEIEPTYARIAPKAAQRFETAAEKALALASMSRAREAREAADAALALLPLMQTPDPDLLRRVRALASAAGAVH
ncbi:serine/threonine-protein kinase [Dokdonella fugitiva]|uniref:Serine/threonine-protein kinase n=1 Tax=Dokdonella fugitiva TaxID=328517 RepID=A0A839F4F5_9GAMM|nr:serine/threonine-protein kinase [Dokdonella fugitiva]MBA8888689.1 serine/threonine-protein kinase [Dokdonella fugitiva]